MKGASALKAIIPLIAIIILIECLIYISSNFLWADIVSILKQADLVYIIGYGTISIVVYWLLRTLRWSILLKNLNITVCFFDLYMCNAVSLGFSILTPFQSGEALKIELLKKYCAIDRIPGYSSFAIERVIDLFVIVSLVEISILGIFDIGIDKSILIALWTFLLLSIGYGALASKKIKKSGQFVDLIHHMRLCIGNLRTLSLVVILTFCSWIVIAKGWQICLYSISIDIGFQKSLALTSTVTIINILSFIPGAIGVSEASIAEVLIHYGYSAANAQAGAFVLRFYGILTLILSALHILIWKFWRNDKAK